MSLVGNILLSDLARHAAPFSGGRMSSNEEELKRWAHYDKFGVFPKQAEAKAQQRKRDAFESKAVADVEQELSAIEATSGVTARERHGLFHGLLTREKDKLAAVERKRDELLGLVEAPAKTRSKIAEAVAATKAFLLGKADEPAVDRAALDAELATATHRAQAASEAMTELDSQIEIATLRVNRLGEAEKEFHQAAMREIVRESGLLPAIAKKRGELAALNRLLDNASDYCGVYAIDDGEVQRHEIKWRHSWDEIAEAIRENPAADVGKLLPKASS